MDRRDPTTAEDRAAIGRGLTTLGSVRTPKTALAAALITCGIPLDPKRPFFEVENLDRHGPGKEYHWNLHPSTLPGATPAYLTRDLVARWLDPAFHQKEGEHPLAYIRQFRHNYQALMDLTQGTERRLVQWKARGKLLLLSEEASPDQEAEFIAHL